MTTLHFNGQSYDIDTLPDEARAHVASLQFVDAEMARLKAQLAAYQTARNAYVQTLKAHLSPLNALANPKARQIH